MHGGIFSILAMLFWPNLVFYIFTMHFRLRVAFLPMRLHLHQSQLDFLIGFFGASSSDDHPQGGKQYSDNSNLSQMKSNDNLSEDNILDEALLPYFQASIFLLFSIIDLEMEPSLHLLLSFLLRCLWIS